MTDWSPNVVVVGTDGSPGSHRAAAVAAAVATRNDAELHIITVVRPPEGWWGVVGSPPTPQAVANAFTRAQSEILQTTVAAVGADAAAAITSQEIGDPAGVLMNYCADRDADLLVVGRRGAGLVERMVVGSVADRVVHHAPCPVLVVP